MSSRKDFETWGCSDRDLSITLKCETYAGIAWLAWQAATKAMEAKCAALAAENAALKDSVEHAAMCIHAAEVEGLIDALSEKDGERLADLVHRRLCHAHLPAETPATDAYLAEVRGQAHKEGAYFVANRMLAAWDAGFIEDTAKNAADIPRMILTSTEFMPSAPEGDFDRSFADGVLEDIAAQLRQGGAE